MALIVGDESVKFCRWSRDGKCLFTLGAARRRHDAILTSHGVRRRYSDEQYEDAPADCRAEDPR
jgi:hypothetical protein